MSRLEQATDEHLRALLGSDGPEDRVYAAFELARRLDACVVPELVLGNEAVPGVRMHWLTVLAAHGETEAVRAVAEGRGGTPEGDHALVLALQIGASDPEWAAECFVTATDRCRAALLARDAEIDWSRARDSLEGLLQSDLAEVRRGAAARLRDVFGLVAALRGYAVREGDVEVLRSWAESSDHAGLLEAVAAGSSAASSALERAGRRYPLSLLSEVVLAESDAIRLAGACRREDVLDLGDAAIDRMQFLPQAWSEAFASAASAPFTADEAARLAGWAREEVVDSMGTGVLQAMGCPTAFDDTRENAGALQILAEADEVTPRAVAAVELLIRDARLVYGERPLAGLSLSPDGVAELDGHGTWRVEAREPDLLVLVLRVGRREWHVHIGAEAAVVLPLA